MDEVTSPAVQGFVTSCTTGCATRLAHATFAFNAEAFHPKPTLSDLWQQEVAMKSPHKEKTYGADKRSAATPSCRRREITPQGKPQCPLPDVQSPAHSGSASRTLNGSMQSTPFAVRTSRKPSPQSGRQRRRASVRDPRSFSTAPTTAASPPRVAATRLVPRLAPDASPHTSSHFRSKAPPIGYRRFG